MINPFHFLKKVWLTIDIPCAAVFLSAAIGAVLLNFSGANPLDAYGALFQGSFGGMSALGRTLEKATPLIFSGLAVAFAFKAGLFNIGTQGQLLFGALAAAVAGFGLAGMPGWLHAPLALLIGAFAGGIYSAVQGALKAYTGSHEVITGIMLNYVAINLTDYLTNGPLKDDTPGNIIARTPLVMETSWLHRIGSFPVGFGLALIASLVVWWFLERTTFGFEISTVGHNSHAASYAGMNVKLIIVWTMLLSGILAGFGGAVETLGVVHRYQPGFNIGLGFEGITIALLGKTHPVGVVLAALLVGAMKAGSSQMQFHAGVDKAIIDVILALILFFVAADVLIRKILRRRETKGEKVLFSTGWSK